EKEENFSDLEKGDKSDIQDVHSIQNDSILESENPTSALSVKGADVSGATTVEQTAGLGGAKELDGGLTAWLQVVGNFFITMTTWGLVQSFGVFENYYHNTLLSSIPLSWISLIGSIESFLMLVVGIISGPLFDAGYHWPLTLLGSLLVTIGMFMVSISKEYYQVMLSQGVCVGIGSGLLYLPSVTVVTIYFKTKRVIALGIANAGAGIGGIVFTFIFRQLEPQIGFGWATRVLGFVCLTIILTNLVVLRPLPRVANQAKLTWEMVRSNVPYLIVLVAYFFFTLGLYVPFFYLPAYAQARLHVSEQFTFTLVPVLNGGSCVGRVLGPLLVSYFKIISPLVALTGSLLVCAVMAFLWITIQNTGEIYTFCLFYGMFSGSCMTMIVSVVVEFLPVLSVAGSMTGIAFAVLAVGLLIGNPIVGSIVSHANGSYIDAQVFTGVILLVSAFFLVVAIIWKGATKSRQW
ncbi:major facilitator superfamily domain-containing protein, partial [Xylogone sp. PMI_703]